MKTVFIDPQKPAQPVTHSTIEQIVTHVAREFKPEKIVLFGSYAVNHETKDSDVDLLVVMNTDLPQHKRSVSMQLLFKPMPCAVDFLVFTPDEIRQWYGTPNHIITNALDTGKIMYEKGT